jgi:hypothetical protein
VEKIINTTMTNHEKEALLGYFEFTLMTMIEDLKVKGIINDSLQVGALYEGAYNCINEIEQTLAEYLEITHQEDA